MVTIRISLDIFGQLDFRLIYYDPRKSKEERLHPWVKVDLAIRPLPPIKRRIS